MAGSPNIESIMSRTLSSRAILTAVRRASANVRDPAVVAIDAGSHDFVEIVCGFCGAGGAGGRQPIVEKGGIARLRRKAISCERIAPAGARIGEWLGAHTVLHENAGVAATTQHLVEATWIAF
jgi:hypothetical protein